MFFVFLNPYYPATTGASKQMEGHSEVQVCSYKSAYKVRAFVGVEDEGYSEHLCNNWWLICFFACLEGLGRL